MSIVAFDGTDVFYDSICVSSRERELKANKVHVSPDQRFIACSVGSWGWGMLLAQRFFDIAVISEHNLRDDLFIPASSAENLEGSGEVELIVLDLIERRAWMYDDCVDGFGALPLEPFIIGHTRAVSAVASKIDLIDSSKWAQIASDLQAIEGNTHFNDRVTKAPYHVLSTQTLKKVSV